ncbi:SulP family inorganic anion transporter [Sunxiuqinia sp. A32]|uniref:SulP family inorganic anion transporter n=1 Tax=Sunxiuqinia sp. A32 TaxID=3461496 RepID=UPI004045FCDF
MERLFLPKFYTLVKQGISKKELTSDIFSGVVVGVVALPLAIAFAVASGVSPEKGLITAVVAGFIISLLGGSRVQIAGPTGAFIVIVYGIVEQYGINGLIISTIMAGVFLIAFGLLRLGALLRYFPHPLIVGFTSGIALVIFSSQVKDVLGLNIEKIPAAFLDKWSFIFQHVSELNITSVFIAIGSILVTVYSKLLSKKIPGSFIAIIVMTIVVQIFGFQVVTIETFFGEIHSNFSFDLPEFQWSDLGGYVGPALTIALLGGIESLLSAVVSDGMISGNHRSNTELIAQGIANVFTPLLGGIPATGAIARTATNVKNGGRTPIAGMVHAVTLLLIMLFFGQWAKLIPMSCLAGILVVVAYNMSEWRSFYSILKGSWFDAIILLTTFFLTVLVDLTIAIQIGVVLSSVLFMKRMTDVGKNGLSTVDSDVLADYSDLPKELAIYEISGPFFFASAKQYSEVIKSIGINNKMLIIRMRHVPFIDATGIHNFKESIRILRKSNTTVILSGVNSDVKNELDKSQISSLIGDEYIFSSFEEAVDKALLMIEKS